MLFGNVNTGSEFDKLNDTSAKSSSFPPYNGTQVDFYMNYIAGISLIFFFLVSTTLNPVLFYYNYRQPRCIATLLFMLLEFCDFMTNCCQPILTAIVLMKPYYPPLVDLDVGLLDQLKSFFIYIFVHMTNIIAASLAASRYFSLVHPFKAQKYWVLWTVQGVYALIVTAYFYYTVMGYGIYDPIPRVPRHCGFTFSVPKIKSRLHYDLINIIRLVFTSGAVVAGLIFSTLTIYHLGCTGRKAISAASGSNCRKGARMIALINIGNLLFVIVLILFAVYGYAMMYATFLVSSGVPMFLSAYNPIIFMITTHKKVRKVLLEKKPASFYSSIRSTRAVESVTFSTVAATSHVTKKD